MPVEYAMGYRKPPVEGRFQKGQSGNPAGRPKPRPRPTRRQRFAQMLEADLMEPVEKLATTPTRCTLAAGAKGMALDGVRGKIATIRTIFDFMDELDVMEGNLEPRRRARPARMPQELEAAFEAAAAFENEQETDGSVPPVSQRIIEEPPSPLWGEDTDEAPGFASFPSPPNLSRPATAGRPDEASSAGESEKKTLLDGEPQSAPGWMARSSLHSGRAPARTGVAGHDRGGAMQSQAAASPLSEGKEQGLKPEWERSFLTEAARNARKVPSEKEQRKLAEQAEMDRQRRAYESVRAKVKAYAEKRGYEFPETGTGEPAKDLAKNSAAPLGEGQGTINSHPEEGPNKRALRQRFERLAAANRMEAERKAALAAKAEGSLMLRQAQHEGLDRSPRPEPVEGRAGETNMHEPEPLPDYAIWMRGQRAPP